MVWASLWARALLRRSSLVCVWALVCLLTGVACGGSPEAPAPVPSEPEIDEISYELFPTTRLLSSGDLAAIQSAGDDGMLTFDPAPSALDGVETGMVLVGGMSPKTPEGLLRGVGAVQREGTRLTMQTMVVPIQLAFRRLSVHSAHRVRTIHTAKERDLGDLKLQRLRLLNTDATGEKNVRWVLFDGDGDEDTLDDQVRLEGALGGGFYFDARFEVNWGAVENLPQAVADCLKSLVKIFVGQLPDCTPLALLPEAKATFEVGPDLRAHADLIGSASLSFEKELAILKMSLTPIPIGPIVLVPGVDVLATLSGSAGAHFRTGFDADLSARMALVASTKNGVNVTPPSLTRSDVKARDTELAIMAKGRVSLGARISMSLYGIIGPYAQVDGFAELVADTSKNPCWEIAAGLSAHAGLLLTTPRLPVLGYVTLFDLKTPTWDIFRSGALASGTCSFAKGTSLPGAGPDEQNYGKPSFPTWASVTAIPGDALFASTAVLDPGLAFSQMERTTDGRFLASVNQAERLSKLDEAGKTTWTRGFASDDGPLRLGRLGTLRDSSIVIGTTFQGAPALLRVNQEGDAFPGSAFSFAAGCTPGPIAAIQALPGGLDFSAPAFAMTGGCNEGDRAYLLTASASGEIREARILSVPAPATLLPRSLAVVDGSLWWLATYTPGGITHVAAVRMDFSLQPQASSAYVGACENNRRIEPAFARPAKERSELLVVGSSGSLHEGLFLRLRPDATVAVGSFPSFGPGASDVAVLQSIAELPTTGYVVSGSHRDVLSPLNSPYQNLAPFVAWLDSGGSVLTARRFVLDGGGTPVSSPRLDLTDDGGLMVASARSRTDGQHDLWAMKTFAKDGSVSDPRVTVEPFPFKSVACGVAQVQLPVSVASISVKRLEFFVQAP